MAIFGNPKAGKSLMPCQQTLAINLPQKILNREYSSNRVRLTYHNPGYLELRHIIQQYDDPSKFSIPLMKLSTGATAK